MLRSLWKGIRSRLGIESSTCDQSTGQLHQNALVRGNAQLNTGDLVGACKSYREAIALLPGDADSYLRLGYALTELDDIENATAALENCIRLDRQNADAHYLIGTLAAGQKRFAAAAKSFSQAINIQPSMLPAYPAAAIAFISSGQHSAGIELMSQAIRVYPDQADFHFYLGDLLGEVGRYEEAAHALRRAVALDPAHAFALASLGNSERNLGRTEEAISLLRSAIALKSDQPLWHSHLLFTLLSGGRHTPHQLFVEHLRYAELFEKPHQFDAMSSLDSAGPLRGPLKIGYVSGDLRAHSIAFFMEPVLRHHDKRIVEVFAYYTCPFADEITSNLRSFCDHWRDCAELSDEDVARQVRNDRIDVLVDLSGHSSYARLGVFARRAAPVQMSWLGYQFTTGLSSMDYRITDNAADPVGKTEQFHTERLIRLSTGAVFQPYAQSPDVRPPPSIASGTFTFACLNSPAKITDTFVIAASKILLASPRSRLLVGNLPPDAQILMRARFAHHGVAGDRLWLMDRLAFSDYLALHHHIDLTLDTFPYNGGTTTFHSLWMGVPVLALEGEVSVGRVGSETMRSLGFPTFACADLDIYVQKAIAFANDPAPLEEVRALLRKKMEILLVHKAKAFTAELESTYIKCSQSHLY